MTRFMHSDWLRAKNVSKSADWSRTKFPSVVETNYVFFRLYKVIELSILALTFKTFKIMDSKL